MSARLDVDSYVRLSQGIRDDIDQWVTDHLIEIETCKAFELSWQGPVEFVDFEIDEIEDGDLVPRTITRSVIRPFPHPSVLS